MNTWSLKHSLAAAFALAGVMALSPVSQALAGDTSVTLGDGDTATVQGGGTKVEADGSGNVSVYLNGNGSVSVYTDDSITVRPAVNDAEAVAKAGDRLADGTIYAGNGLAATPADAPGLYTWTNGKLYCEDLIANGHDDWTLPARDQLRQLYQNKDTGTFAGTFNDTADGTIANWYWSSEKHASYSSEAWFQSFTHGDDVWYLEERNELSVRCVRAEPTAP